VAVVAAVHGVVVLVVDAAIQAAVDAAVLVAQAVAADLAVQAVAADLAVQAAVAALAAVDAAIAVILAVKQAHVDTHSSHIVQPVLTLHVKMQESNRGSTDMTWTQHQDHSLLR